jgi:hypothetical protein
MTEAGAVLSLGAEVVDLSRRGDYSQPMPSPSRSSLGA